MTHHLSAAMPRPAGASAPISGGAAVVEALRREGVDRVFCVPGESFLGVLDALYDAPEIAVLATRHEGGAAFMAEAYAKASGRLAVCMATRGVGATNLAIGIHAAQQDSTPLLALLGQVSRSFRYREAFQEVNLAELLRPITKWAVEATDAARLPELIHKAVHLAISGRPGPVAIALPEDILNELVTPQFSAPALVPRARPAADDLLAARELLREAQRPLILAGGGLLRSPAAAARLVELAELSETPVVAGWRRFDVFPHAHRLFVGTAGLGAAEGVFERIRDADLLLVVGSRLGEITSHDYQLPAPATRVVQIDIAAEEVGANYTPAVGILADCGLALADLAEAIRADDAAAWEATRARRQPANAKDRAAFLAASVPPAPLAGAYVDPALAIVELQRLLPPEAILISDVGNFSGWLARYYRFQQPGTFLGPTSGAMGYGLPAAIAAKLAHPARPVVACVGDGSLLMTLTELETAVRARTPLVLLVFDNQMYGTIRMHQELEHPGRVLATRLSTPDLARTAESFGAAGFEVRANEELGPALAAALACDRPALVHLHIDPARISVGRTLASLE
jgi:acetolactate synthase I/II/III large subunit